MARSACTTAWNTAVSRRASPGRRAPSTPEATMAFEPQRLMRLATIASMLVAAILIVAKVAAWAGLVQAGFIAASGGALLLAVGERLINPHQVREEQIGLAISVLAVV